MIVVVYCDCDVLQKCCKVLKKSVVVVVVVTSCYVMYFIKCMVGMVCVKCIAVVECRGLSSCA